MMDTTTRRMTRSRKAVDQSENKDNTKKLEEDSKTKQLRPRAVRTAKKQENKLQEPVVSGKITDQPIEEMSAKIETRQTRGGRKPLQPKQDQQESQHETGKQGKTKGTKRVQGIDQKDNKANKKALNPKTRGWTEPFIDPEDNVYFGKINDEEVRKKFKSLDKEAAQARKQQQKEGRGKKKKDAELIDIQEEAQVNPSNDAEKKTNESPEEMQVDIVDDMNVLENTEKMISQEKEAEQETGNSVAQDKDESLEMLPTDLESSVTESPELIVSETSVKEVVNESAPIQSEAQLPSEVETMQQETSCEEISADQDGTQDRDSLSAAEEEAGVKEAEDLSGQTEEQVTAVVQEEVEAEATGANQSVVEQVSSIESEVDQMPEKDEIVKEDVSEDVATPVPTESQENVIQTQPQLNESIPLNETLGFSLLEDRVLASPQTVQRLPNTPKVDLPSTTKKRVSRRPSTPATIERKRSVQATPLPLATPKTTSKMLLPILESPSIVQSPRHLLIRSETFVRSPCPTPIRELVSDLVEKAGTSLTSEINESIRVVTSEEQTQEPTMTVIQEESMEEEVEEATDAVVEHEESPIESEVSAEPQSEEKMEAFSEDVSDDFTNVASNEMESQEQTQEQAMNVVQEDTKEEEKTVTNAEVVEEIKTISDDFEEIPLKTPKKCLVYTPRVRMTPLTPKTESVSKVRGSRLTPMKTETGMTPKRVQRLCNTPKGVDLPSTTKKRVASKPSTPATNGRKMASKSTPLAVKTPKTSTKTLPVVTESTPVIESPKLVRSETFVRSPCLVPAQDMASDLLESALIEAQVSLTPEAVESMKPLTSEEQIQELLMTAIQEDPKEADEEDAAADAVGDEVPDSPESKTEDKENAHTEEVNGSEDEVPNEETANNDLEAPATNESFRHNDTQEFALLEAQVLNTPLIETGVPTKVKKNLSISKIPRLKTTPNRLNSPLRFNPMELSFLAAKGRKSVASKIASPLKESPLINASPSDGGLSNVSGLKLIDVTAFDLDVENRASSLGLLNKDLMDMTLMARQSMSRPSTITRVQAQDQKRPSSLGLMKELLEFSVLDPRSSSANNAPKDN